MKFPNYREYKPSSVSIIGAIPAHWDIKPLRQIGRLLKGSGGSKEDVVDDGVPCVRYGDLYTTHSYVIERARTYLTAERASSYTSIQYGDVLFAASGEKLDEIGKSAVNLIRGDARCGGDLIILRPGEPMVPRFLGYAADASPSAAQKASMGRGTTVKHIYPNELRDLTLAIPPITEQEAIADFLDRKTAALEALIATKEVLLKLLAEKRRALIMQTVTMGLDPNVPMKDSGVDWLGKMPAHWMLRRLKQLSHRISGRLVYQPAQYFTDAGVPFIMGNNVTERGIVLDDTKYVPAEVNARFAHHALQAGDVVMVRVGAPGVTAVVGSEAEGLNCGSLMIVRRNPAFVSTWLAAVMNSPVIRAQIDMVQYGAAQEQINITDAVNFLVPTPPVEEQERIAEHVAMISDRMYATLDKTQKQLELLREYRQALITAVVTGKLDVTREAA